MAQTAAATHKDKRSLNRAFASHFAKSVFLTVLGLFILSLIATRMFTHVDLNLYGYMVGTLVFIGGFFYRFIAWGERPPTKIFIKKGLKLLCRRETAVTAVDHLAVYRFIWNRGLYRWTQHLLIGWGCILSCFVTFPLVFGWMYFTMPENGYYTIVALGINVMTIKAEGIIGFYPITLLTSPFLW